MRTKRNPLEEGTVKGAEAILTTLCNQAWEADNGEADAIINNNGRAYIVTVSVFCADQQQ